MTYQKKTFLVKLLNKRGSELCEFQTGAYPETFRGGSDFYYMYGGFVIFFLRNPIKSKKITKWGRG